MFTSTEQIHNELVNIGLHPQQLKYIDRGVMTDKYLFLNQGKYYIVRCFQPERAWLASAEYKYLELFSKEGIKAPIPYYFSEREVPFLIYERLEGDTLSNTFYLLTEKNKKRLCDEIVQNYTKITGIKNHGFGRMYGFELFSETSWEQFLIQSINAAEEYIKTNNLSLKPNLFDELYKFAISIKVSEPRLIWSDFSSDNIIVQSNGSLSGFIDFEGLLSGDPYLGIGYFKARQSYSELYNMISESLGQEQNRRLIDFYSIIRWCRLLPYQKFPMPNGKERMPLNVFLPYSNDIMKDY